jgi:hypothetical protein
MFIMKHDSVIQWLLEGDPSIRWQTMRDLLQSPEYEVEQERKRVAETGWGAQLLSYQDPSGMWGNGLYSPKWISTTYTMLLLRLLGLSPDHPQTQQACAILLDRGFYNDGGINYFKSMNQSETCVSGMILGILAYFRFFDERLERLVRFLLEQQMTDGGWNCLAFRGATHSSFHTTMLVMEGLHEYQQSFSSCQKEIDTALQHATEFLLLHKLFRSHRTGAIVKNSMTQFSFPPQWYYDILRALDFFQSIQAERDNRFSDAIEIVLKKRKPDGTWHLQNRHPGKSYFEMEKVGQASRWNTLRALRVLEWWNIE